MSLDFSPTPADCGLASPSHFTLVSHPSVRVSCLVLASDYFRLPHLSHTHSSFLPFPTSHPMERRYCQLASGTLKMIQ